MRGLMCTSSGSSLSRFGTILNREIHKVISISSRQTTCKRSTKMELLLSIKTLSVLEEEKFLVYSDRMELVKLVPSTL